MQNRFLQDRLDLSKSRPDVKHKQQLEKSQFMFHVYQVNTFDNEEQIMHAVSGYEVTYSSSMVAGFGANLIQTQLP